jgi:hypothetical protein
VLGSNIVVHHTYEGEAVHTATLTTAEHHRPALVFFRHLGEMTLAMFGGMFAFGLILGVIAGLAGSSLESVRVSEPELFMLGMGSAMSVTMIAWMRHRRHSWRQGCEMTAAMFVPVLAVLACYWASAITADPVCPLSCVLMIPAMAAAMLFRLDVYTARHAQAA